MTKAEGIETEPGDTEMPRKEWVNIAKTRLKVEKTVQN